MLYGATFDLPYPLLASLALAAGVTACAIGWRERRRIGGSAVVLLGVAGVLLAAAAGGLRWSGRSEERVQVMVDLSPSTRGAHYREGKHLQEEIARLLGDQPYDVIAFGEHAQELRGTESLKDLKEMPSPMTRFEPSGPGPVLLFSDGQFELPPGGPPVFAVVDGGLEKAADGRVAELRDERGETIAILENTSGAPRAVAGAGADMRIPAGRSRMSVGSAREVHRVALTAGDLWPENDVLASLPQQPANLARWSVGVGLPDAVGMDAAALPTSAEGLGFVTLLAIDAGVAGHLSDDQQRAIGAYVRELGGSLVLVGQDAHWADLRGSELGEISPLAIDPPEPKSEWVVLLDASGSMAQPDAAGDKWQHSLRAAEAMIRGLPAGDRVRIGSFGRDLRWWPSALAGEIARRGLETPADVRPHGPTNLAAALEQAVMLPTGGRREILLLSDAEVELNTSEMAGRMRGSDVRFSSLMLSAGSGKVMLEKLAQATGGVTLAEADPTRWGSASRELARAVAPVRWQTRAIRAEREGQTDGGGPITGWNLAWLKRDATVVAKAQTGEPLAARWNAGVGKVMAVAWPAGLSPLIEGLSAEPDMRDLRIHWPEGNGGVIAVDAKPGRVVQAQVRWVPDDEAEKPREIALELAGPGRYAGTLPGTMGGAIAVLQVDGQVVGRRAFGPRYPAEFNAIGNDHAKLEELCRRTGGRIVSENEPGPLPMQLGRVFRDLSVLLGAAGTVTLGLLAVQLRKRL
jgi:von Willebrand factor type A domain